MLTSPRGVELTEERMEEIRALDGTDGECLTFFSLLSAPRVFPWG